VFLLGLISRSTQSGTPGQQSHPWARILERLEIEDVSDEDVDQALDDQQTHSPSHVGPVTACRTGLRQPTQPSRVLLADSGLAAPQCGQRSLA
jgi:hypothetical protein